MRTPASPALRGLLIAAFVLLAGCRVGGGKTDLGAAGDGGARDGGPRDGGVPDGGLRDGGGDGGEVGCGQARGDHLPLACDPSGAVAEGACRCVIGWHFDGKACVALGGCRCVRNCDRVYAKLEDCQLAYVLCLGG